MADDFYFYFISFFSFYRAFFQFNFYFSFHLHCRGYVVGGFEDVVLKDHVAI